MIDGESLDSSRDLILLVGLGVLVLVGVFATELANESWDLVQKEVRADEEARLLRGDEEDEEDEDEDWDGMIGPFNTTATRESMVNALPQMVRDESALVWTTVDEFCDAQWLPAVSRTVTERRDRLEKEFQAQKAFEEAMGQSDNVFSALATLGDNGQSDDKPKGADESTEAERDERARLAAWALDGPQPWRQLISSTFFSFALMGAARRKWVEYPKDEQQLDLLLGLAEGQGTDATVSQAEALPQEQALQQTLPEQAAQAPPMPPPRVEPQEEPREVVSPAARGEAIAKRRLEIDERLSAIDKSLSMEQPELLRRRDDEKSPQVDAIAKRRLEIDARLAEIDAALDGE